MPSETALARAWSNPTDVDDDDDDDTGGEGMSQNKSSSFVPCCSSMESTPIPVKRDSAMGTNAGL